MHWTCLILYFALAPALFAVALFWGNRVAGAVVLFWAATQGAWALHTDLAPTLAVIYAVAAPVTILAARGWRDAVAGIAYLPMCLLATTEWMGLVDPSVSAWTLWGFTVAQMLAALWTGNEPHALPNTVAAVERLFRKGPDRIEFSAAREAA